MAKKQNKNARLGIIGETYVQMKLMQQSDRMWEAFNANSMFSNYKGVDIICINHEMHEDGKTWKPRTSFIQVKTTKDKSFPIGLTIGDCLDEENLRKKVIGPWVFVKVDDMNDESTFKCYVLTREQVIELAHKSHDWYVNGWKREKPISLNSVAALREEWLRDEIKKCEEKTEKHEAFENPLKGAQTRDAWENIWKD